LTARETVVLPGSRVAAVRQPDVTPLDSRRIGRG